MGPTPPLSAEGGLAYKLCSSNPLTTAHWSRSPGRPDRITQLRRHGLHPPASAGRKPCSRRALRLLDPTLAGLG
jgi:hypothetical protein